MRRSALSLGQTLLLLCLCSFLVIERLFHDSLLTTPFNGLGTVVNETDIPNILGFVSKDTKISSNMKTLATVEPTKQRTALSTSKFQWTQEIGVFQSNPTPSPTTAIQVTSTIAAVDCADKPDRPDMNEKTRKYLRAIMNSSVETDLSQLNCGSLQRQRYSSLHYLPTSTQKPRYFFALDLFQSAHLITQLLGSIVEVIRFLGPDLCVLSVVEGRSTDGTFEVLKGLSHEMESIGVRYHLSCNELDPMGEGMDRILTLAQLRNQALWPLTRHAERYDPSTTVIFLNDIAPCAEDILELIHQRVVLKADMTCAMDWIHDGETFYDVWIGRQLNGDSFFEVPQSVSWEFSHNLFWNHEESKSRYSAGNPVQVFSCWNGAVAITASPFLEGQVEFRSHHEGECHLGEPVHLAKDLWKIGHGKIAVLPNVNIGYSIDFSAKAKEKHGTVSAWAEKGFDAANSIVWQEQPPGQIKCMVSWEHPSWEPWDLSL